MSEGGTVNTICGGPSDRGAGGCGATLKPEEEARGFCSVCRPPAKDTETLRTRLREHVAFMRKHWPNEPEIADDMEAAADALSAPPQQWQPIETAPKSADAMIVYAPDYSQRVVPASWDDDDEAEGGQCWRAADAQWDRVQPTLWQPLPAPPVSAPPQRTEETHEQIQQRLNAVQYMCWPTADAIERAMLRDAMLHESSPWCGYTLPASKLIAASVDDLRGLLDQVAHLQQEIATLRQDAEQHRRICLAELGGPAVWPCGCHIEVVDSHGATRLLSGEGHEPCEYHAAMVAEIATMRADLQGARADVDQFIRAVDALRKGSIR